MEAKARPELRLIAGGLNETEQALERLTRLRDEAYEALLDRDWIGLLGAADELLRVEAKLQALG